MFDTTTITRDLVHRFFENQMQIDGGSNDRFTAFSDAGGLVMGYIDGSHIALWGIASHYVLADNFFMGAFGGSFLNHQYLICACAPEYPNADTDVAKPTIAMIDADGNLVINTTTSPLSALDGPPVFALSGNLVPKNYFGDGTFRAVNTMQPPYQPSANPYAADDASHLGPSVRVPAIIVSPYAKAGTVDHAQYDTASILRLIARRFDLDALPGITARDAALVTNGGTAMGDLTNSLDLQYAIKLFMPAPAP